MKRLLTLRAGALAALVLLVGCGGQKAAAPTAPPAQPPAAVAKATPPAPAPIVATVTQVDVCKDTIMDNPSNRLTERSARRLQAGMKYRYLDRDVVVNQQGIWGGCKTALETPAAQSQLSADMVSRAEYNGMKWRAESAEAKVALQESKIADLERQLESRNHPSITDVIILLLAVLAGMLIHRFVVHARRKDKKVRKPAPLKPSEEFRARAQTEAPEPPSVRGPPGSAFEAQD